MLKQGDKTGWQSIPKQPTGILTFQQALDIQWLLDIAILCFSFLGCMLLQFCVKQVQLASQSGCGFD